MEEFLSTFEGEVKDGKVRLGRRLFIPWPVVGFNVNPFPLQGDLLVPCFQDREWNSGLQIIGASGSKLQ